MRVATLLGPDLKQLLRDDPEGIVELAHELHPEDVADVLRELSAEEIGRVLSLLSPHEAARIFERIDDHEQRAVLPSLERERAVELVAAMASDRRAKLFRILTEPARIELLAQVRARHEDAAREVDLIDHWPEKSAGRLMTTSFVAVPRASTVGEALEAMRAHGAVCNEPIYAAYALDESGRLVAFARVREFAPLARDQPMADVWRKHLVMVGPNARQDEVARIMAKYDLSAVPVIDESGRPLGLITIDDIVDVLSEEATRAFERAGAVEPLDLPYFKTSFLSFIRKRGLWLVILFVEEFFTQTALRHYDPVFTAIHGASYYVPLLISTGGNSGSQSATLVIRGMSVRELEPKHWWRILVRESGMGLALGLMLGLIGFGRVLMYREQHVAFAATIGLTLVGIVIVGCTVGSMLPLVLRKLGIDPATSSTPFIASLVDVLGIIVFVHVAKIVMADVIARGGVPMTP